MKMKSLLKAINEEKNVMIDYLINESEELKKILGSIAAKTSTRK